MELEELEIDRMTLFALDHVHRRVDDVREGSRSSLRVQCRMSTQGVVAYGTSLNVKMPHDAAGFVLVDDVLGECSVDCLFKAKRAGPVKVTVHLNVSYEPSVAGRMGVVLKKNGLPMREMPTRKLIQLAGSNGPSWCTFSVIADVAEGDKLAMYVVEQSGSGTGRSWFIQEWLVESA